METIKFICTITGAGVYALMAIIAVSGTIGVIKDDIETKRMYKVYNRR
jgi:hypothetical protein